MFEVIKRKKNAGKFFFQSRCGLVENGTESGRKSDTTSKYKVRCRDVRGDLSRDTSSEYIYTGALNSNLIALRELTVALLKLLLVAKLRSTVRTSV